MVTLFETVSAGNSPGTERSKNPEGRENGNRNIGSKPNTNGK